jgi:hypothetical protein
MPRWRFKTEEIIQHCSQSTSPARHPENHADCVGNYCDAVLSDEIVTSAACWMSSLRYIVACVLRRIILTERDREIAGWCVNAAGLGRESASDGNRTALGQLGKESTG